MAARFRSSTHGASASSRRRRLLLLGQCLNSSSESSLDEESASSGHHSRSSPVIVDVRTADDLAFDRSFSEPASAGIRTIPQLVESQLPVSWLFVGDSFTPKDVREPRPWRVFTNRFAGAVSSHFQRPKDVFIDATFPQARLSEVLFDFERRIAKFEPDICFLSLSLAEADSKAIERFERMLVRLIRWSKKFECQLVIQTPPCLPSRNDAEFTRRLILVESIRGITSEHGVVLIDHWDHWEGTNPASSGPDRWIDPESGTPDEQGHRQLATRLIQDLKLKDAIKPTSPEPQRNAVSQINQ